MQRSGRRIASRTRRTSPRGIAAVEFVMLLALIVVVVLFGSEFAGLNSKRTFTRLSSSMESDPAGAGPRISSGPASQAASRAAARHPEQGPATGPVGSLAAWRLGLLISLVVAVGYVWLTLRRQRHREEMLSDEEHDEPSAAPEALQQRLFAKRQEIFRIMADEMRTLVVGETRVEQVMTRDIEAVSPDAPLEEIHDRLAAKKMHHMLVCDKDGKAVGLISDRDLARKRGHKARDVMTPDPVSVAPDCLLSTAIGTMLSRRVSCLPVVEAGRLRGVLTGTDLIMTLQCSLQLLQRAAVEMQEAGCEIKFATFDEPLHSPTTISELCRQSAEGDEA